MCNIACFRLSSQWQAWEHMRPAHIDKKVGCLLAQTTTLAFPLNGIRPLPSPPGTINCWFGNTVHWGSSCHQAAVDRGVDPRASIALVFRNAASERDLSSPLMTYESSANLSVVERLSYVHHSLHAFSHWYKLPQKLVSLFPKTDDKRAAVQAKTY